MHLFLENLKKYKKLPTNKESNVQLAAVMSETVQTDEHLWPDLSAIFSFKSFKRNNLITICN